jgi:hypothetical protein
VAFTGAGLATPGDKAARAAGGGSQLHLRYKKYMYEADTRKISQ